MNKPVFYPAIAACMLLMSCQSGPIAKLLVSASAESEQTNQKPQTKHINGIDNADPTAAANIALQKGDYRLLAMSGRVRNFPGLEQEPGLLEQHCGYQILANSSDALESKEQHAARKKLYQYAAIYNQLVFNACYKDDLTEHKQ